MTITITMVPMIGTTIGIRIFEAKDMTIGMTLARAAVIAAMILICEGNGEGYCDDNLQR